MKHQHTVAVDLDVDIETENLEQLVDKIRDAALLVIAASTVGHILRQVIR